MKKKIFIKILAGIVTFLVLIFFLTILFVDPWIGKIIRSALNEKNSKYQVEIEKVHFSIFTSGLALHTITVRTKPEHRSDGDLNVEISSIKCKGISLTKAMFHKDIEISEVIIFNSTVNGVMAFSEDSINPIISSLNIQIGKIIFDIINLNIKSTSSAQAYVVKEGVLNVYDLQVLKKDTVSFGIVKLFDFNADELLSVSSDSMYTNKVNGTKYSATSNTLVVDSFFIHPNFKAYDFTSRHKFQSDCIEAGFSNILVHDFSAAGYLKTGSLVSSYVEIGIMDMKVFRDRREPFSHITKPMFQDMIYNYPHKINIDSIGLLSGNVTYTEHAVKANHPGRISFNKINAKIYKITNDTVFKKEGAYFELRSNALLMGKGKLTISLKSQLYNSDNTFTLDGTLSAMEAKELNPMLERNAFLYAASGRIEEMNFAFTANNNKATGKMTFRYHGLDLAVKNKETDDTTAIKEIIVSWIANMKTMDSNPLPGKEVRVGIIENERDPEKFLFNYCFKSILSGIKSSIANNPSGKKK